MIGLGERILIDLSKGNPSEIHRTLESYITGYIPAGKDFHNNFKMCVGMFDLCDMAGDRHTQIHFLLDLSNTGLFGTFMFSDFTAGKFP